MIKCNLKKVISLMTSVMILFCFSSGYLSNNSLTASAICCRKDGFDKSRYTLTGNMAQDVATIAKSQAGRTCSQFGYSGVDYGAWCDEYVADCLENAGCDDSIVAHGGTVADFEEIMRKKGAVAVSSPQPGDLIFFSWSHVEIVTRVENGTVYCAGGNNQGKTYPGGRCAGERNAQSVAKSMNGSIRLYLRPNYTSIIQAPNTSVLSIDKTMLAVGDEITFTASSDYATGFTIGIDKDGGRIITQDLNGNTFSFTPTEAGDYYSYVTAWNSIGLVDSPGITFKVYDSAPSESYLSISGESTTYEVNSIIGFVASSDIATGYTIGIDKDGSRVVTQDLNENTYSYQPTEPGNYYAYVTSWNKYGICDSKGITFKVYDSEPTYSKISLDKSDYNVNDGVQLNFESDNAIWYSVGIYKDGKRYDSIWDITENTYVYQVTEPGIYSAYVTSRNTLGWVDSQLVYFNVYSTIDGDCNNDGQFSVADVVILQKWLFNDETELTNWQSADLDEDGTINVFDLCLMKQKLINK